MPKENNTVYQKKHTTCTWYLEWCFSFSINSYISESRKGKTGASSGWDDSNPGRWESYFKIASIEIKEMYYNCFV